jgi:lysophospholipase L1-like esterase
MKLTKSRPKTALVFLLAVVLALALPAAAPAAKGGKGKKQDRQFYVSLGDSYSTGYQPAPDGGLGGATTDGYANQLPRLAKDKGYKLKLVNFGCGGETTSSLLERTTPCPGPAVGGPNYAGKTQIAAAEEFIRKHRRKVGVISVSIGGNDITSCVNTDNPAGCVAQRMPEVEERVKVIMERLRAAAGSKPEILGLTYPDVILGLWTSGTQEGRDLAALSVFAFREFINPAFKRAYESQAGTFVDVTANTDAYIPLDQITTYPPYGEIPIAVATVCRITYYCEVRDIHAKAEGYLIIAELMADSLPKRKNKKKK